MPLLLMKKQLCRIQVINRLLFQVRLGGWKARYGGLFCLHTFFIVVTVKSIEHYGFHSSV